MKCSFCNSDIKLKLGFNTLFSTKEKFQLCIQCREHIGINTIGIDGCSLYFFADYDFLKEDIYSIKYFGDVACALKFKELFKKFFSLYSFDLVTIVPANGIREIIRGFDHIEQICKLCDVKFEKLLYCEYREKQSKMHKERKENKYHLLKQGRNLSEFKKILIIDDIYTSGNTLLGCAKAIKNIYPNAEISFLTLSKVI